MRKFLAGLAAGLVLATGGVAVASIPGSDGRIHGCYRRDTGALRVIDRDRRLVSGRWVVTACRSDEAHLSWRAD